MQGSQADTKPPSCHGARGQKDELTLETQLHPLLNYPWAGPIQKEELHLRRLAGHKDA